MSKPYIHAQSSARRYGGTPEDYMDIHQMMDSSKNGIADNRHRVFTHNSWFISAGGPLERIFGVYIVNSDGRKVSTRDIGEQHILEDFGNKFIPTPQDYLEKLPYEDWMNNGKGAPPPSHRGLVSNTEVSKPSETDLENALEKLTQIKVHKTRFNKPSHLLD